MLSSSLSSTLKLKNLHIFFLFFNFLINGQNNRCFCKKIVDMKLKNYSIWVKSLKILIEIVVKGLYYTSDYNITYQQFYLPFFFYLTYKSYLWTWPMYSNMYVCFVAYACFSARVLARRTRIRAHMFNYSRSHWYDFSYSETVQRAYISIRLYPLFFSLETSFNHHATTYLSTYNLFLRYLD